MRVNWFGPTNRVSICGTLVSLLGSFQSREHIQKVRGVFGPNAPLYNICSLALEVPEGSEQQQAIIRMGEQVTPGLDLWYGLWRQCRMICMIYIHALVYTSESIEATKFVLEDIVDKYRRDFPTIENPFDLLWTFMYALQLSHNPNLRAARLVYDFMYAMHGLDDIRHQRIDLFLTRSLFYPAADPETIVDYMGIYRNLVEDDWWVGYSEAIP